MKKTVNRKRILYGIISAVFWIMVWQAVAMIYDMDFVLPSPLTTLKALMENLRDIGFLKRILFSVTRIMSGFLLAVSVSLLISLISIRLRILRILFDPFCVVLRAVPVASFIILVLVIFSSRNVSVVISFLIGFPVAYSTIVKGIDSVPTELIETGDIFKMSFPRRLKYIYFPHLLSFFESGFSTSAGLCFKSGIAAEVIGYPMGSVGEAMYLAKIGFNMPDMLSYTVVIVIVSAAVEKLIVMLCRMPRRKREI